MARNPRLTEQQLQIVQALNRINEGTARDVQAQLVHLKLAPSTVATVLSRLETKGVLQSTLHGRERIYRCKLEETTIRRSMVNSLVSSLFGGDRQALLTHLVSESEFDRKELDSLKALIDEQSKKTGINEKKGS